MSVAARQPTVWTPARMFMTISALFHIAIAIVGFATDQTFPIGADAAASSSSAYVFGVFETNGWHTLGAVVVGAVSLFYAVRGRGAADGALMLGIFHVGLVISLIVWDPSTFWMASNMADQVIHSSTAIGGIATGLLTKHQMRGHGMGEG